ncbi:hypothetical protein K491DRAFT_762342 [Lophiostoma macrostomum CBS 122681]|uniref:Peptidase S54 rhomboid domain-containing protein n=1 Tax=Lophiostoma macrostomum CBS 122681 TaxID=1314788 RepID=A0A6A6STM8_9PLEO|nr:hypothetical protein K491DRAFT_762342 [Lophiostoma macrostomum CBS 122681]
MAFLLPFSLSRSAISMLRPTSLVGSAQPCITARGFTVASTRLAPLPRQGPPNGPPKKATRKEGTEKSRLIRRAPAASGSPASWKKTPSFSKQADGRPGSATPSGTLGAKLPSAPDKLKSNQLESKKPIGLPTDGLSQAERFRQRQRRREASRDMAGEESGDADPIEKIRQSAKDGAAELMLNAKEAEKLEPVLEKRKRILVPALFAFSLIAWTYLLFGLAAWVVSKIPTSISTPDPTLQDDGIPAPETTTFIGRLRSFRNEESLTMELIAIYLVIHIVKRTRFPWQLFPHIPGDRQTTLWTYSFAHASWAHLMANCLGVALFLPPVNRYFDRDTSHTAAFFTCVPVIAGFMMHFRYRLATSAVGISVEMGASGAIHGLVGVLLAKNWTESTFGDWKITEGRWICGGLTLVELFLLVRGAAQVSHLGHLTGLLVGVGYVYFDGKNRIWVPLCRNLGRKETSPPAPASPLPS